jgi:hypothetical protein
MFTIDCLIGISGYVPSTHTRMLLTAGGTEPCRVSIPGATATWTWQIGSPTPYILHIRRREFGPSWLGTFQLPATSTMPMVVLDSRRAVLCTINIRPQSFKFTDTDATTSYAVSDFAVVFGIDPRPLSPSCPNPARVGTLTGSWTITPDTEDDDLRSTVLSG